VTNHSKAAIGCGIAALGSIALLCVCILSGVVYFSAMPSAPRPARDPAKAQARKDLDAKFSATIVALSGGAITECTVDSSPIDMGAGIARVSVTFRTVPDDLRESLEWICEAAHDVYRSGVEVEAWRPTATGRDRRRIGSAEWNLRTGEVSSEVTSAR